MYVDKRLGGIQAVQTLSRLNRAYPGKDTTYVVDFVNDAAEILEAFKAYYTTATLTTTTDPNLIFDLRAKLDSAGHYDDFEVNRVVAVEVGSGSTSAKQSALFAALEPVADRLLRKHKAGQEALRAAQDAHDEAGAQSAQNAMDALTLFKGDMATFVRLYTFLSQIFDYGNTEIEKRAIFYKNLIRLLQFGRERESADLSALMLTHHTLKNRGTQPMSLTSGASPTLDPITETGSGSVQAKEKARLLEIIEKVNDLFDGELTAEDKLVYVNNVIKGKLLESKTLQLQAKNNSKEQFANSPDFDGGVLNAGMDALQAHSVMSEQLLNSAKVRLALKEFLLTHGGLYEALREQV